MNKPDLLISYQEIEMLLAKRENEIINELVYEYREDKNMVNTEHRLRIAAIGELRAFVANIRSYLNHKIAEYKKSTNSTFIRSE